MERTGGKDIAIDRALISDDGNPRKPGRLSIEWRVISGPGRAMLSNSADHRPMIRCDKAGTYILRLSVSDGEIKTYHDVDVIVK